MAKKNYYMVIDTETCGDYVFDIGYRIIDRYGNCVANGSYVVEEFISNPATLNMFNDRFTRDKIGKYYFDLWQRKGNFAAASFEYIRHVVNALVKTYNAIVCAYNISFDLQHLAKTAQYFNYESFFETTIETIDLWNVAMCILGTKKYVRFCIKNNYVTQAGNIQTGAEIMYRYITNNPDFTEAHTAHEDCIIECAIFVKCLKQKKHFETKKVNPCMYNAAWQSIQEKYKELS